MNDDLIHALKRLLMGFIEDSNEMSLSSIDIKDDSSEPPGPIRFGDAREDSVRVLNEEEVTRMTADARTFINYLENVRVLDAAMRESLINRLMQVDPYLIEVKDVKEALVNLGRPMTDLQRQRLNLLLVESASSEQH